MLVEREVLLLLSIAGFRWKYFTAKQFSFSQSNKCPSSFLFSSLSFVFRVLLLNLLILGKKTKTKKQNRTNITIQHDCGYCFSSLIKTFLLVKTQELALSARVARFAWNHPFVSTAAHFIQSSASRGYACNENNRKWLHALLLNSYQIIVNSLKAELRVAEKQSTALGCFIY